MSRAAKSYSAGEYAVGCLIFATLPLGLFFLVLTITFSGYYRSSADEQSAIARALKSGEVFTRGQVVTVPGTPLLKTPHTGTAAVAYRVHLKRHWTVKGGKGHPSRTATEQVAAQVKDIPFGVQTPTGTYRVSGHKLNIQTAEFADRLESPPAWAGQVAAARPQQRPGWFSVTESRIQPGHVVWVLAARREDTHTLTSRDGEITVYDVVPREEELINPNWGLRADVVLALLSALFLLPTLSAIIRGSLRRLKKFRNG